MQGHLIIVVFFLFISLNSFRFVDSFSFDRFGHTCSLRCCRYFPSKTVVHVCALPWHHTKQVFILSSSWLCLYNATWFVYSLPLALYIGTFCSLIRCCCVFFLLFFTFYFERGAWSMYVEYTHINGNEIKCVALKINCILVGEKHSFVRQHCVYLYRVFLLYAV